MNRVTEVNEAAQTADEKAGEPVSAIDFAHLDRATFGNRVLRREVLRLFDRQAERRTAEIAAAVQGHVRFELAHGLRGAALGVGAHAVASAAAAIENGIDHPAELASALSRLSARVAEARLEIAELLAKG